MSGGSRPGGLTALAVLNFVAAGFDALGAVSNLGIMIFRDSLAQKPEMQKALASMPPDNIVWTVGIGDLVLVPLLIVSGVGYLRMRRVAGRYVGTAYGLASIAATAAVLVQFQSGMQFAALIYVVYPVLTLIMLHTTFKDDLVT
jgi:hypothetical protein